MSENTVIFQRDYQWMIFTGLMLCFALTTLLIGSLKKKLPRDQGRKFAVEGALSEGKARGAGLIFVSVFTVISAICYVRSLEVALYLVLIMASMLTGYFDDAAEKPWGEWKKGILDLVISGGIAATYIVFNGTEVNMALLGFSFEMPIWLYAILATGLVWMMINVTNCTDGVDGLSSSLVITVLASFAVMNGIRAYNCPELTYMAFYFIACLLGYLLFNSTPSIVLMGDAGSRAMGTLIAVLALLSRDPFMVLIFVLVIILDGGLGLLKLFLARTIKLKILKNTRTPLHDHVRKVMGWSNTQCVFRFVIIQIVISAAALWFVG